MYFVLNTGRHVAYEWVVFPPGFTLLRQSAKSDAGHCCSSTPPCGKTTPNTVIIPFKSYTYLHCSVFFGEWRYRFLPLTKNVEMNSTLWNETRDVRFTRWIRPMCADSLYGQNVQKQQTTNGLASTGLTSSFYSANVEYRRRRGFENASLRLTLLLS